YKYYRLRGEFYRREGETEKANEDLALADELETQPVPTATPLPGPTLSLDQLKAEPTPNLLQGQVPGSQ
ncbi:MAG: hypothetical protein KC978_17990, partial [Candidatus Omnitrophica bacterium]|nr:hypothetical protein [Candidatus Omnitrophota bacterium]